MSTNINIVVKDKDTPVPDTGVITPDTGRYTNTNSNSTSMEGGMIAFTIILSFLLLLSIALIFFSRLFRKKAISTTTNSTTNKTNLYSSNNKTNSITTNSITKKANLFRTLGLLLFIFTTTTGIVASILRNNSFSTYATDTPLDITTSDTTITVVREDGPAYAVASAEITLNEATPAGYNLYVYGPDGNKFTSTTTIATIDTVAEKNSIISNNTYGVANTTNEPLITDAVWNPVGDTEDNAELIATSSNATNVGDKITIYYGILVDETLPAGIYTGSIEYKAYTRTYTITYDANGGTFDDDTTTTTQYIAKGSSIGTLPDEPEREDYTFQGWFAEGSEQQVTTDTVPTEDITYFAKWKKNCNNNATTVGTGNAATDAVCMQDINSDNYLSFLNSMTEDAHYNLIDSRDEKVYTVSKLRDGRIWMTTNLDLTGGIKLTHEDTNIAEDYVLPTENGFGEDNTLPVSSIETGFLRKNSAGLYNSNNAECGNQPCYSYYTWVAATAGSELNNDDEFREAPYSICPSGWMLPRGGSFNDDNLLSVTSYKRSDYYRLFVAYGMNTSDAYANDSTTPTASDVYEMIKPGTGPNLFGNSGRIDTNRFWSASSYYWTSLATHESTLTFGSEAFYSVVSPTLIRSNLHYYYNFGYSVRCIVAAPKVTVTFDANDGVINEKSSDSVDIAIGSRLAYLPEATRDNYTFVGWFTEANGGEEVTESIKPLADVTYYAHWVRNTYAITFDPDGGFVIGTPTVIINAGDTLGSRIPSASRGGYDFLGWYPAESEERITTDTIPTGNTTYYAHWEERPLTLQNTYAIAAALPNIGDTIVAPDERDGIEYTVGRLADDRIWLLDNLALDLTMEDAANKITSENTNASSASLHALFFGEDSGGDNGDLARVAVTTDWYSDNDDYGHTEPLVDIGYSDKTMSDMTSGYEGIDAEWLIGVYYNYCAASAGSHCYDEGYNTGNVAEDVCPAGWRMPTGGNSGEYYNLYSVYSYDFTTFREALRAPFSSYANSSDHPGTYGYFWSSTMHDEDHIYGLYMNTDELTPNDSYHRINGYSVRCIMEDKYTVKYDVNGGIMDDGTLSVVTKVVPSDALGGTIPDDPSRVGYIFLGWFTDANGGTEIDSDTVPLSDTTYYAHWEEQQGLVSFQDIATINSALQNVGDTTVVRDDRDGKAYTVGRLADNNIWLLDNLDLDLTMEDAEEHITENNTNASSTSLDALFNGGGIGQYARNGVSTGWEISSENPYINTSNSGKYQSGFPIGTYYNFCAASAGSYCYGSVGNNNDTEDICPAGWRIPTGYVHGEYNALYSAYENENDQYSAFREVFRASLAGFNYGNLGAAGSFWSSTQSTSGGHFMNNLDIRTNGVYPNESLGRIYTISVRCIMRQMPIIPDGALTLQNTDGINEAVPDEGDTAEAYDERDGNKYNIGRLADGRVWLLDNLNLNLATPDSEYYITPENTNASATSLRALFHGGGYNNLASGAVSVGSRGHRSPTLYVEHSGKTVAEAKTGNYNGIDADWPIGIYYNYCAASAGSYCYEEYHGDGNATEDICPAGWRLPTGGYLDVSDVHLGEITRLYNAYENNHTPYLDQYTAFRTSLRVPLSGEVTDDNGGSIANLGSSGSFWSSTSYYDVMYGLYVSPFDLNPTDKYQRYLSHSVRCILDNN